MTNWNSDQYLKFQNERTQPAVDLVNRISLLRPMKIIDIGAGQATVHGFWPINSKKPIFSELIIQKI